jgi:hypothetical protein
MKKQVETVDLLNRLSGAYEPASIVQDIDQANLDDYENLWQPEFQKRLSEISSAAEVEAANIQDAHWKWSAKAQQRSGALEYESFAVECGGVTQGLMYVKTIAFARTPGNKGLDLVYVDLLATAPWNRHGFTATPKYKGVGLVLLVTAISFSVSLGFSGRIGLHSLPQSRSWYATVCGMTDLGPDSNVPPGVLHYFEMTEIQAQAFVAGKNQ